MMGSRQKKSVLATSTPRVEAVLRRVLREEVPVILTKLTEPAFRAIQKDLVDIRAHMVTKTEHTTLDDRLGQLTTSIDRYIRTTETWHQEQLVLRHQVKRLTDVLLKKGFLTQADLAV